MISRTKQTWQQGHIVKVGFMTLVVVAAIPTPKNWEPDAYALTSQDGTRFYQFVPHFGVTRCASIEDAMKAR